MSQKRRTAGTIHFAGSIQNTTLFSILHYLCPMNGERIVLFDGVCNYCNKMVNFAIRNDPRARLKFAPMQSPAGERLRQQYGVAPSADSVVFIENGRAFIYAAAALRICKYLRWPAKMLAAFLIVPRFISNAVYKVIARNRYKWWGKKEVCMVPTPEVRSRFLND